MSTVLVTGAKGFIGSYLVDALRLSGADVIGLDLPGFDLMDPNAFDPFSEKKIDHIFHLAGKTFVPDSWINPGDYYRVNTLGTERVLSFCHSAHVPLTYVSAYIYGTPQQLPIDEEHPLMPNNPYAHSKYLAEELCRFYSNYFDVKVCIIRPFNVYGAGQDEAFLIPMLIRQVLKDDVIEVRDLKPSRDFIYITDLIRALLATIDIVDKYSVINIGSGHSVSVEDIISTVQACAGTAKEVHSTETERKHELMDVVAEIEKAEHVLGWRPVIGLREGIREMLNAG